MQDKYRDKKGDLRPYALIRGYRDTRMESPNNCHDVRVQIWQEEPSIKGYHVMAHDYTTGQRLYWISFSRLTDARKAYKAPVDTVKRLIALDRLDTRCSNDSFPTR